MINHESTIAQEEGGHGFGDGGWDELFGMVGGGAGADYLRRYLPSYSSVAQMSRRLTETAEELYQNTTFVDPTQLYNRPAPEPWVAVRGTIVLSRWRSLLWRLKQLC